MATLYPMPKPEALGSLLSDLLGRAVSVTRGEPLGLEAVEPAIVADYRVDDGSLGALWISDLRLSNLLGAALTMVPVSSVDDAVAKGIVDDANLGNLSEVTNLVARAFDSADTHALRFGGVQQLGGLAGGSDGGLAGDIAGLVEAHGGRRDFVVDVDEYGSGRLAILCA